MRRLILPVLSVMMLVPGPAAAQGVRPGDNCLSALQDISDVDRALLGAWIMGYLDKTNGGASLIRHDNAMIVIQNLADVCVRHPQASILDVVQQSRKGAANEPGSQAHAHEFLSQFMKPGANRAALTAAMKPTEDEIRAVYAEPLGGALVKMYNEMFKPGAQIGPKQGQTEILSWRGTTAHLRGGAPVLRDFPGGYSDVRPYLKGDYPIVRFKFVEPGKSMGLAFDGLIFINDHWVLMPKPWRALEN